MMDGRVFVFIPSYRDSETVHTVQCLLDTATHGARVRVAVFLQGDEPFDVVDARVRVRRVDANAARGPCVARAQAAAMYAGEEYVLWLDSHMRMVAGWDVLLVDLLAQCPSERPVLTTYPAGYEQPPGGTRHWSDARLDADPRAPFLVFGGFGAADGMLRFKGRRLRHQPERPLRCWFWVSGFAFARGAMVHEVPYDARLQFLFFGEETSMTVRLHTHGYDFFCPPVNVCYHLWKRDYRPTFRQVTLPDDEHKRLEHVSRVRVRIQLGLEPGADASAQDIAEASAELDRYGMGSVRSVASFWQLCGIDMTARTAHERATLGGLSPDYFEEDARMHQVLALLKQHGAMMELPPPPMMAKEEREKVDDRCPSLEAVLRVVGVAADDALSVVVWGSRVYGTVDEHSDWDFTVVTRGPVDADVEPTHHGPGMDVTVYSEAQWRALLVEHEVAAVESLWLPARCVLLARVAWAHEWKLDLLQLRRSFSSAAALAWVKAKKKLTVAKDFAPRVARKSLFHALRLLDFGTQIGTHGRIVDYASSNAVWREVMAIPGDEWPIFETLFKKRYNAARSAFKRVAPLE